MHSGSHLKNKQIDMTLLGTIDTTKKFTDTTETRLMKKMMNELGDIYSEMGIVPYELQMIINKLRDEFHKENGALTKTCAMELDPISQEFDKLTEKVREYHAKIREMGKDHKLREQQLALKFIELELKIVDRQRV